MHCPSCGTQDVRKVSMVYENGVQKTRSRTLFGGGLLSLFGPALGVGGAVTRGRNTTLQAERLAPPQKAHPFLMAFLIFLAMGLFGGMPMVILHFMFGKVGTAIGSFIYLILIFGLPIFVIVQGLKNNHRLPAQLEKWNNLFICERCGDVFTKEEGLSEKKV